MKSILSGLDMEIMVSFSVYFSLHAFIHTHIHLFIYLPIHSYVHQVFVSVDSILALIYVLDLKGQTVIGIFGLWGVTVVNT